MIAGGERRCPLRLWGRWLHPAGFFGLDRTWSGRGRAALPGGEDELRLAGVGGLPIEQVGACPFEQRGQDVCWLAGAVSPEDMLIEDSAGNFHAGKAGDLAQDLIEAGVVRDDCDLAVAIGYLRGRECRANRG